MQMKATIILKVESGKSIGIQFKDSIFNFRIPIVDLMDVFSPDINADHSPFRH